MSQNSIVIANGAGSAVRAATNNALDSLVTKFSGPTAPTTTYPFQYWADTGTGYLYQRDSANSLWMPVRPLDTRIPQATYSALTYTVAYTPALSVYKYGLLYPFTSTDFNTGACSFNGGPGAKPIYKVHTDGSLIDLSAGDIVAGSRQNFLVYLNVSSGCFVHLNPTLPKALQYARYVEKQSSGVNGGTFTSGAWQQRLLNTEVEDNIGCSLSSNRIVFPFAGVYLIRAFANANKVGNHQALLWNYTDNVLALAGSSASAVYGGNAAQSVSIISGKITVAVASKAYELRHRCQNTIADVGLGQSVGFGQDELYAQVEIWRES